MYPLVTIIFDVTILSQLGGWMTGRTIFLVKELALAPSLVLIWSQSSAIFPEAPCRLGKGALTFSPQLLGWGTENSSSPLG